MRRETVYPSTLELMYELGVESQAEDKAIREQEKDSTTFPPLRRYEPK